MRLVQIATNISALDIARVIVYFSYETPVAYREYGTGTLHILRNGAISATTSRHCTKIREFDRKIYNDEFVYMIKTMHFQHNMSNNLALMEVNLY